MLQPHLDDGIANNPIRTTSNHIVGVCPIWTLWTPLLALDTTCTNVTTPPPPTPPVSCQLTPLSSRSQADCARAERSCRCASAGVRRGDVSNDEGWQQRISAAHGRRGRQAAGARPIACCPLRHCLNHYAKTDDVFGRVCVFRLARVCACACVLVNVAHVWGVWRCVARPCVCV